MIDRNRIAERSQKYAASKAGSSNWRGVSELEWSESFSIFREHARRAPTNSYLPL
jgi:hypothetical protein